MLSRFRDRPTRLEGQVLPQPRVFVLFQVEDPDLPPYAERLAAFKAENGVGPHDIVHEVTVSFN